MSTVSSSHRRRHVAWFFQSIVLFCLLLVERVAGLPILFLGFVLPVVVSSSAMERRVLLAVVGVMISIVYSLPLYVGPICMVVAWQTWLLLVKLTSSITVRLLSSIGAGVGSLLFWLSVGYSWRMMTYSLVSIIIVVLLTKLRLRS